MTSFNVMNRIWHCLNLNDSGSHSSFRFRFQMIFDSESNNYFSFFILNFAMNFSHYINIRSMNLNINVIHLLFTDIHFSLVSFICEILLHTQWVWFFFIFFLFLQWLWTLLRVINLLSTLCTEHLWFWRFVNFWTSPQNFHSCPFFFVDQWRWLLLLVSGPASKLGLEI